MFKLDNDFLEEVGLSGLPDVQKKEFLAHTQEELEIRVGVKMSEGLTDEQVREFERVIDGDETTVKAMLAESGDYKNHDFYKLLIEKGGFASDTPELEKEFASIYWLAKNRPDYQQIVAKVAGELKNEIMTNKAEILGANGNDR
ncbi:MAG: DUF5663 domain-containing protein [Candidatus Nomurabacteria bacterium]|jgi:hypothetical protein|nr:DUF5663 domain-containing protein [Candidatus Nomurabacteria bacterium]